MKDGLYIGDEFAAKVSHIINDIGFRVHYDQQNWIDCEHNIPTRTELLGFHRHSVYLIPDE